MSDTLERGTDGRRLVGGLVVPFGVPVYRGWWKARFNAGGLTVDDVAHVPFMFEHGGTYAVAGVMVDVVEDLDGPDGPGIYATFALDDTPDGDRAAAEFDSGSRTGFSAGLAYDDETLKAIGEAFWEWDGDELPIVDASGAIREVSHVAVPAFTTARGRLLSDTADDTEPAEQTAGAR